MLTTCLACHRPFPENETLEHFSAGHRIAFDPARGRLWAVCPACARWTLAPFEARWEALEELERVTRDRARLLAETDNIGLLEAGDVELVRVGRAGLREESWWRFGKQFAARRKRAKRTALKGKVVDGAIAMLITGIPFWGHSDAEKWIHRARKKHFGKNLWAPGDDAARCSGCGHRFRKLRFSDVDALDLRPHPHAPFALAVRCPKCGHSPGDGADTGRFITGLTAEHVLRRSLAYRNFAGGTESTVDNAVRLVEAHDATDDLLRRVASERTGLGTLTDNGAFALEIALSEGIERRLLEMELTELDARWRREEEIAAIADRL